MSAGNDPAYPSPGISDGEGSYYVYPSEGMTKREWYAGLAMQGILSSSPRGSGDANTVALVAAIMADTLLEELTQK